MRSAGDEGLLAGRRRGSRSAQTVVLPSFVGSSALARAAAGAWPSEDAPVEEPELAPELEESASADPATLEDESEPKRRR